jgi:hypothetical protein
VKRFGEAFPRKGAMLYLLGIGPGAQLEGLRPVAEVFHLDSFAYLEPDIPMFEEDL